jgi:hypothetical protein
MTFKPAYLTLLAGLALGATSCTGPEHATATVATPGGVGVVSTLPAGWNQPSYYYNGQYYYGGRWETGQFEYHGHTFPNRYYHNGQYLYGGRYSDGKHHPKPPSHHKQDKKHHHSIT